LEENRKTKEKQHKKSS